MYLISFVVTSIEDERLFSLIDSYKQMKYVQQSELIILFKNVSKDFNQKVADVSGTHNIRIIIAQGKSRVYRKDMGVKYAQSDFVGFIDSDCVFDRNYIESLVGKLNTPIIRGRTYYEKGHTWVSKRNSIYRTLCDEVFFKNETFSPNLIFNKQFLIKTGGWNDEQNIDSQDDFILSQRIKKSTNEKVNHIQEAIIYHDADHSIKKLLRNWWGYGVGYGYRYWISSEGKIDIPIMIKYTPPLVYVRGNKIDYFVFSTMQWTITFLGFIKGLIKHRKSVNNF